MDAAAPEGGDGSAEQPLRNVQAAVDALAAGTVMIAGGTYAGAVTVDHPISLRGRCPELVTLDAAGGGSFALVVDAKDVALSGFRIVNGDQGGIDLAPHASVVGEGLTVSGNRGFGVRVLGPGARLELSDATVEDTTPEGDDAPGYGVLTWGRAEATLRGVVLTRNTTAAVAVGGGPAQVSLEGVTLSDTALDPSGAFGVGLAVVDGGVVTGSAVHVVGNRGMGVLLQGEGATLDLLDSLVEGTLADAEDEMGRGVSVQSGASFHAARTVLGFNLDIGLYCSGEGTSCSAEEVSILDTQPGARGRGGRGLSAQAGAWVEAVALTLSGNHEYGIYATDPGTRVALADLLVEGTLPSPERGLGQGVNVQDGADLAVTAGVMSGNTGAALTLLGATAALEGVDASGTLPADGETNGVGLYVGMGGALSASDCVVASNRVFGVWLVEGSSLDWEGGEIAETQVTEEGGNGYGLVVADGSTARLRGADVHRNAEAAILVQDAGSRLELEGGVVEGTVASSVSRLGVGVAAQGGAEVSAAGVELRGHEGPGLYVVEGARISCDACLVHGNQFADAVVLGGSLELVGGNVSEGLPHPSEGGGLGVYATSTFGRSSVLLDGVTLAGHPLAAVWIEGEGDYQVLDSRIEGGAGVEVGGRLLQGNALFARDGVRPWSEGDGLLLQASQLVSGAGASVLLHDASGSFEGNTWEGGALDVVQQHCAHVEPLEEVEGAHDVEICPDGDLLYDVSLDFDGLYLREADAF